MGFLDKIRGNQPASSPMPTAAYDPVCGMTIDPKGAAGKSEHAGHAVYFCSAGCKRKFDADPTKFASKIRPA